MPKTAVLEPDTRRERRPKPLSPHAVIVLNDNDHTVDYVVTLFQKVFGYSIEKCLKLALDIHEQGRGIVWTGPKEVAELKHELIKSGGPDLFARKSVHYPLGCLIEPLP